MGECLIVRSGGGTDTTNATAKNDDIVSGYTCYVNDELIIGNIPSITLSKTAVAPSEEITLLYGSYKNTNISTSTLEEETVSTAASSDILKSYNGWTNGIYIDGNIVNNDVISQSLSANGSYTIPQGWHNNGKVTQTLSTQAAVGITAKSSNQTVCAANKWTTGDLWVWGNSNLVKANIKNGVNIFGVVGNFTGWVDNNLSLLGILSNRINALWVYDGVSSHHKNWWIWTASLSQYLSIRSTYTGLKLSATAWLAADSDRYDESPYVLIRASHWVKSGNITTTTNICNVSESNGSYSAVTKTVSGSGTFIKTLAPLESTYTISGWKDAKWEVPSHCMHIIVNVGGHKVNGSLNSATVTAYK